MRSNQLNYVPERKAITMQKAAFEAVPCTEARRYRIDTQIFTAVFKGRGNGGRYPARTDDLLLVRQTL